MTKKKRTKRKRMRRVSMRGWVSRDCGGRVNIGDLAARSGGRVCGDEGEREFGEIVEAGFLL